MKIFFAYAKECEIGWRNKINAKGLMEKYSKREECDILKIV